MAGSPSLVLRYAARSDVGLLRAKNDDSAYAGRYLAVVADGMGGHAGGDVASASTVLDLIHLDRDGYQGDADIQLADEIQIANSLLSEMVHVNPKLTGMGTTVTALLLSEGKLAFAHIGDSRAYRLKGGIFEQISTDHTFVQRLIDEGRLTPEEAEVHPHKNVLMRVLGDVDASPELDVSTFEVTPGERWLLCSDGLNFVDLDVVEQVMRQTPSLEVTAETLINLTLEVGAPDNVTVVLVEVAEGPDDEPADDVRVTTARIDVVPGAASSAGAPVVATETATADAETDQPHETGEQADDTNDGLAEKAEAADAPTDEKLDDNQLGDDDPADDPAETSHGSTLGDHIADEVIREELAARPHQLVGAAVTAHAEGKIPVIEGRRRTRRAAAVLTHRTDSDSDEYVLITEPVRRRTWLAVAASLAVILVLAGAAWVGYAWTQTRYYVGESHGKVAIYNGVAQSLGPIQLSHLYSETDISVSSLPPFSQQRLSQTLAAASLADARNIITDLQLGHISPPDGSSPSDTASPGGTGTSSSSPSTGTSSPAPSAPPSSPPASTGGATP
ncbi:PP2C family protein-serine/threonine phosphatase [Psychromicrobium xiongbiense]|uniref:PP2C family protein-serine/threonine phosphatase n=1 Tax=Psychromicrobium xiongbiense TaxID=3051184 RepID=UPI0025529C47|nr:PP2C family serine/threonine-protein phosphatase [Psychromicrobium sp. YIM S02556]